MTFGTLLGPSLQRSSLSTPGLIDLAELSLQSDVTLQVVQPDTTVLATLTFQALSTGAGSITLGSDPNFGRDVKGLAAQVLPVPLSGASVTITVTP